MCVFLVLSLIVVGGGGSYNLEERFIHIDNKKVYSSDKRTKTSVSSGYVEQKGEEAAVGSIALVDDAGVQEWVKVP